MRCHYEVLGVERDVDETGLKKAYRVAALQWHPDKNQHRLEEADLRFKEIQNAYEVLSDKHERAWYDDHRDQILRGGSHQAGETTGSWWGGGRSGGGKPKDEEDLYSYFTTSCYAGYADGPRGFYAVYEGLFEKLARQEETAFERREERGRNQRDFQFPARFGGSGAAWSDVSAFYAHWLNFATYKEFSWMDEYNPASAPNRKVRRLMEDENAKRRKAARRAYNDAVRELAAFVRKRDKRVIAHQAEEQARKLAKEAADAARREDEKAARAAAAAQYRDADWIAESAPDESSDEEDVAELVAFACELCDKRFKSKAAFTNHERSKKHMEAVAVMRAMLEEEEGLDADAASGGAARSDDASPAEADGEDGEGDPSRGQQRQQQQHGERRGKKKKRKRNQRGGGGDDGCGAAEDSDAYDAQQADAAIDPLAAELEALGLAGRNSDSERSSAQPELDDEAGVAGDAEGSDGSGLDTDAMLERLVGSRSQPLADKADGEVSSAQASLSAGLTASVSNGLSEDLTNGSQQAELSRDSTAPAGSAKPRRAKANGQAAPASTANTADAGVDRSKPLARAEPGGKPMTKRQMRKQKGAQSAQAAEVPRLACGVCGAEFDSRTLLFKHIASSGHALLKT